MELNGARTTLTRNTDGREEPKKTVPELIGLTKEVLLEDLSNFNIDAVGEGNYIIDQAPKAGTKLESGSKIRVYLSDKINRENE